MPPHCYPEIAIVGDLRQSVVLPASHPKTAAQWINKYDGLDNLLACA